MITTYKLFTAPNCPKCPNVKDYILSRSGLKGEVIEVSPARPEGLALARRFRVTSVPHIIFFDEWGIEVGRARSVAEIGAVISHKELVTAS